jgi:DNA-binding NarL/FixJ family response regulator
MSRIRILIADDHDVVVRGLETILQAEPDFTLLLPAATTGPQVEARLWATPCDVALLDVRMPEFDVLTMVTRLRREQSRLRVILVTALPDPALVREAAQRGAHGYLLKDEPLCVLLPLAIRAVHAGQTWFSPQAARALLPLVSPASDLTTYQRDVLRLMVAGRTPTEIAQALGRHTAAIHSVQRELRNRLGVATNEGLVATAIRQGLAPLLTTGREVDYSSEET